MPTQFSYASRFPGRVTSKVNTKTNVNNNKDPLLPGNFSNIPDSYHPAVEDIDEDGDSHMVDEWAYGEEEQPEAEVHNMNDDEALARALAESMQGNSP